MALDTSSVARALIARIERHEIHEAVCRHRNQGLACSTCTDLRDSAARACRQLDIIVAALAAQLAEAA